ncbi:MAG TPA: sulfite reductase subunit A, partial [Candidatus Omnitrophica bacterium]|nr:sulfite reductase subunit A [Candidatus Omnitrophota bacterium]
MGVRSCELAAIRIHDKVFLGGSYTDTSYKLRRANALIIAVNCIQPGGTCFCASMGTGPEAKSGFDLCLTEILEKGRHCFVIESGSRQGEEILKEISHHPASKDDCARVKALMEEAGNKMGRQMEPQGLKAALLGNPEHPQWEQIAQRCLSCAN